MKPAPFEYDAPRELDEALGLLARYGENAKVLAGGQSLVPLLNFRLARPARLIDINRLNELAYLRRRDGVLRIGALTRSATLERSRLCAESWPVLVEAVRHSGHPQIRCRGTVGGSVAHGDPRAELPTVLTAVGARFTLRSARGTRTLGAEKMFLGFLTTAVEPDELVVEVEVPPLPEGTRTAFVEYARVHGDFAVAGVAAVATRRSDGTCTFASFALLGAAPTPVLSAAAARALLDGGSARDAAAAAVEELDLRGHRGALLAELTRRAAARAGVAP